LLVIGNFVPYLYRNLMIFASSVQVTTIFICWRPADVNDCELTWPTSMETADTPYTTTSQCSLPRQSTDSLLSENTLEMQVSLSCLLFLFLKSILFDIIADVEFQIKAPWRWMEVEACRLRRAKIASRQRKRIRPSLSAPTYKLWRSTLRRTIDVNDCELTWQTSILCCILKTFWLNGPRKCNTTAIQEKHSCITVVL